MYKGYKIGAVIVAAGSGLRFGERKQFKKLGSKPLYLYSLQKFIDCKTIDEVVLVVPKDLIETLTAEVRQLSLPIKIVSGGEFRQDSVVAGVNCLTSDCEIICVHDAARPFVTEELILNAVSACEANDGAVIAIQSRDTVKEIDSGNKRIKRTIPRETIWLAQTPQVFYKETLIKALSFAKNNRINATDEATLLESLNYKIIVVEGNWDNFKITNQSDWHLAELILE